MQQVAEFEQKEFMVFNMNKPHKRWTRPLKLPMEFLKPPTEFPIFLFQ